MTVCTTNRPNGNETIFYLRLSRSLGHFARPFVIYQGLNSCPAPAKTLPMRNSVISDYELAIRLSVRDPAALKMLARRYLPVLCRFAELFVVDPVAARTIARDTFVTFWHIRLRFDGLPAIKALLFVLTRNGCMRYLQKDDPSPGGGHPANSDEAMHIDSDEKMRMILAEIVRLETIALL
jgi:hypothetical protein